MLKPNFANLRWMFTGATYTLAVIMVNVLYGISIHSLALSSAAYYATLLAGFVFVLRDYVQRTYSRNVTLAYMFTALCLVFLTAPFVIAKASVLAFTISELVAFLLFRRMFSRFWLRVFVSSIIAVPLDSLVFVEFAGLPFGLVVVMTTTKLVASVFICTVYLAGDVVTTE